MKKLLCIILALVLALSLCACGGSSDKPAEAGGAAPAAGGGKGGNSIALGQDIELDFVKMNFSNAVITYSIGGSGISTPATDGMYIFSLVGSIMNTGSNPLPITNVKVQLVFNGEYTYDGYAFMSNSTSYPASLAPLAKNEYHIYAQVPETLTEILSDCEVRFSFNDNFESTPEATDKGDHQYVVYLDESVCAAAAQMELVYFAECPILPTPVSYSPVYQSSNSSSSSNGKTTSIKYGFSVNGIRNDNIKDIYAKYVSKLSEAGFEISGDNGSGCTVLTGGVKLATVKVEGERITFDIVPGNEGLSAPAAGEVSASEAAPVASGDTPVAIGESIETDYLTLSLDSTGTADEIRSGSDSYGIYRYYESENGDPYFYIRGVFKNLGGAPVNLHNVYIQFCFDGKYNYKGSMDGLKDGNNDFVNEINPLSSVDCYIFADVPQELLDSYTSCTVRIGFTESFDWKVVDNNDLPKFENCDDVFVLELSR